MGDSNSVGLGDLYNELRRNFWSWYPDYSPAHFIHKNVGIDVISFGFAGAGSIDGIWSGPINQFNFINSQGFNLKPPKTILVLFYEGNDIANSLQFVRENYTGNEGIEELMQSNKFNEWLNHNFNKSIKEYHNGSETSFMFTKFLIKSVKNIFLEESKKNKESQHILFPATPLTQAIMNGRIAPLPVHLQAPPLGRFILFEDRFELLDKKKDYANDWLKVGYYIFERAVEKLKGFFQDSDIKIIYLPSVLSSYEIISPDASFRANMGKGGIVDTKKLFQRHLEVCQEIFNISQRLEVGFFDTTRYFRDASSNGYIHGPKDWDHLNESGYRALSDSISQYILHPDDPYPNCVHIS